MPRSSDLALRRPAPRLPALAALIAISGFVPGAALLAQSADLRLPISLDAESTDYDGKSSMLLFRGLRLTQGNIGVEAEEGRASKLDFEDSVWQFSGNVVIDTEDGHIECDLADLKFSGHQLRLATITGSPATFEMRRPGSQDVTYAEARRLNYDFAASSIEFSGDAMITEGGNQITSNFLVYNIAEQRIKAQSGADGEDRVKIIYTPRDTDAGGADKADAPDEAATEQTPPDRERPDESPPDDPGIDGP